MTQFSCETVHYPSANKQHTIAGYLYTMPGIVPRAIIQISHGMCEYVGRYRYLIQYFTSHGFVVAGNDHLGHGGSTTKEEYGHFAEKNGYRCLLADLKSMNTILHQRHPGLPLVLYGHSMGSFFARWYAELWPDTIDTLILSGTAGPSPRNRLGLVFASLAAAVAGPRYHSAVIVRGQTGAYCKRIPDAVSRNAWISTDPAVVQEYDADPQCSFNFTASAYRDMLTALTHVSSRRWAEALPKNLPILLVSGTDDPVGDYGDGVRAVYAMLGDAGMQDLTCNLYKGGRHEMHNETEREKVFADELNWMQDRLFDNAPAPEKQ